MKNIKLLVLFLMITSNFSFGQCEKKINDYIQMIKSMSCVDVNNQNSQAMMNFDRVGKELANSCTTTFLQRGEEIKKATIDKVNSCGSNINSNSQSNNQSNNNYNSTYNSKSSSNSKNSSGSVGTSSMNRGGNIVTGNSNSQNQNNPQEELARQQQEKLRLQQEKTNQEVEKANQQLAEINRRKEDAIRIAEQANQDLYNKTIESTTNMINTSVTNSIQRSLDDSKRNDIEIRAAQEEFAENNLSDKEIDSLLANPDPNNYSIIKIYNDMGKYGEWHIFINGKKIAKYEKKKAKVEYKIYNSEKLTIQVYGIGGLLKVTWPLKSFSTRIRKGKQYDFIIVKEGMYYAIEPIENEPLDKKGNKKYESVDTIYQSDIEY